MAVAVDEVVAVAVGAVAVAVMVMVARKARGNMTKAISSALNVTPMDTMPTGAPGVRRRRMRKLIMPRRWIMNLQCCSLKWRSQDSLSICCRKMFRFRVNCV